MLKQTFILLLDFYSAHFYSPEVFDWTTRWLVARKVFMDSNDSAVDIPLWIKYINANTTSPISDYEVPRDGFKSFNEVNLKCSQIEDNFTL